MTYLRVSAAGIPAMLVVLAVTGVLRGLQDTRTPLVASVAGFGANIALNLVLVYGAGLGHRRLRPRHRPRPDRYGDRARRRGHPPGPRARREPFAPHPGRVLRAATDGACRCSCAPSPCGPCFLVTTWVAAGLGDVPVAAYQVSVTVWSFLAFALDALAIAGQALTGKALGAGDVDQRPLAPPGR